jgi:uncharacterized protein (DUF1499 family)
MLAGALILRNPVPRLRPFHSSWLQARIVNLAALLCSLLLFLLVPPGGVATAEAALLHLEGPVPAELGVKEGHLAACATPAHCARETWPAADPTATLERLLPAVLSLEGVQVVATEPGYLHATATSRLFGFVDDLELHADATAGVIEARSTSRLGDSDLGVNARRLTSLKAALQQLEGGQESA